MQVSPAGLGSPWTVGQLSSLVHHSVRLIMGEARGHGVMGRLEDDSAGFLRKASHFHLYPLI